MSQVIEYFGWNGFSLKMPFMYLQTRRCLPASLSYIVTKDEREERAVFSPLLPTPLIFNIRKKLNLGKRAGFSFDI